MGIKVESIATSVPPQKVSTQELINELGIYATDKAIEMIQSMTIENRHSVVEEYPRYLIGKQNRNILIDTNELAINSINNCLNKNTECTSIGLFIAITNTAVRPLPCTAYEILGMISPELIPKDVNVINMQNQGCSVLIKAIEIANDFLKCHPEKKALITVSECHTAYIEAFSSGDKILSFHEITNLSDKNEKMEQMTKLQKLINCCLFGDGAVSLLLEYDDLREFHCKHITNINNNDIDLLYMDQGGTKIPLLQWFSTLCIKQTSACTRSSLQPYINRKHDRRPGNKRWVFGY